MLKSLSLIIPVSINIFVHVSITLSSSIILLCLGLCPLLYSLVPINVFVHVFITLSSFTILLCHGLCTLLYLCQLICLSMSPTHCLLLSFFYVSVSLCPSYNTMLSIDMFVHNFLYYSSMSRSLSFIIPLSINMFVHSSITLSSSIIPHVISLCRRSCPTHSNHSEL